MTTPLHVKQGDRLPAGMVNDLIHDVDRLRPAGPVSSTSRGQFMIQRSNSRGRRIPQCKISLGYQIVSGNEVKIFEGKLVHGPEVFDIPETTVTMTGSVNFVFVEYTWNSSVTIPSPVASYPVPTDLDYRRVLYDFSYNGSTTTLNRVHNFGDIHIPSAFK